MTPLCRDVYIAMLRVLQAIRCAICGCDWKREWRFRQCRCCKRRQVLFTLRRADSWIDYHRGVVIDDDGMSRKAYWNGRYLRLEYILSQE